MALSLVTTGLWVAGTASASPGFGVGYAIGDLMVMRVHNRGTANPPALPTFAAGKGWRFVGSVVTGTGTLTGVDVGDTRSSIFVRTVTVASEPAVTVTGGNPTVASIQVWRAAAGKVIDVAVAGFGDATSDTTFAGTAEAALDITVGDVLLGSIGVSTDAAAISAQALTAAGITLSAVTVAPTNLTFATGNDGSVSGFHATVEAGTATVAPAVSATLAAASTGSAIIARLREADPAPYAAVSDDFTRPDNTTTLGTAPTGQAWDVQRGTWGVDTGQAISISKLDSDFVDIYVGSPTMDVSAVIPSLASGAYPAVIARAAGDGDFWAAELKPSNNTPANTVGLLRRVAGTNTQVASGAAGAYTAGATVEIRVSGDTIGAYIDGVLIVSTSDAALNTQRRAAFRHGAAGTVDARWDTFRAADPTAPAGGTTVTLAAIPAPVSLPVASAGASVPTFAYPAPIVLAAGVSNGVGADAKLEPGPVPLATTLPASLRTSTAQAAPVATPLSASLPPALGGVGARPAPLAVANLAALPITARASSAQASLLAAVLASSTPAVAIGAVVQASPSVITSPVSLPAVTARVAAVITVGPVTLVVALPPVTTAASVAPTLSNLTTVAAIVALSAPIVASRYNVQATVVPVIVTAPATARRVAALRAAATIGVVTLLPLVTGRAGALRSPVVTPLAAGLPSTAIASTSVLVIQTFVIRTRAGVGNGGGIDTIILADPVPTAALMYPAIVPGASGAGATALPARTALTSTLPPVSRSATAQTLAAVIAALVRLPAVPGSLGSTLPVAIKRNGTLTWLDVRVMRNGMLT